MKKYFLAGFSSLLILSCSDKTKKQDAVVDASSTNSTNVKYIFEDGLDEPITVEVKKTPERAALFSQFITEMILALDLGDKIVLGTTEGGIYPKFVKEYEKVPQKIVGHHYPITREAFLLLKPDFVSGYDGLIKPETMGTPQELIKNGIYPFTVRSIRDGATLDTVYEDFYQLGKIFNVEEKAAKLVSDMKSQLAGAENKMIKPKDGKKAKVLLFSTIENGIYVAGGLATDLVNRAHGENIYKEIKQDNEMVSYESLADRNPDIIIVAHMAEGMTVLEKMNFLRTHPALKNLAAVKANKMYEIALDDISPGIRNVEFIKKLNKLLYEK